MSNVPVDVKFAGDLAKALDQTNTSIHWKECLSCGRVRPYGQFRRDSSYREGVRDQCYECETSPRLSTEEHTYRLSEMNYSAARSQRWGKEQLDFIDEKARKGRYRHHSEIIRFLQNNVRDLYFMPGNFLGDISIFRTYGRPQPKLDGRTFEYLFYIPEGYLPEHSLIEFDHRDVPIREKERGWRTPLLRFIKLGLLTEQQVEDEFGGAYGPGAVNWHRQLYQHRNKHT